jgi:protein TonB
MRIIVRSLTLALAVAGVVAVGVATAAPQEVPRDNATPPRVTKEVKPEYTAEAKQAGIQGSVVVEAVVQTDGKVGDVTVTRSLDTEHGLDQQAVKAVKQWEFEPGKKNGKAVSVAVQIELTFTLK